MKVRLSRRKGVSPIIAQAMLVGIVLFASSLAITATLSFIGTQRLEKMVEMQEGFTIEDVYFYKDDNAESRATIFVRNTGEIGIIITRVLINDVFISLNTSDNLYLIKLEGGYFNFTYNYIPKTTYKIEVRSYNGQTTSAYLDT